MIDHVRVGLFLPITACSIVSSERWCNYNCKHLRRLAMPCDRCFPNHSRLQKSSFPENFNISSWFLFACSWPCWKLDWRPWWRSGRSPRATSSSLPRRGRRGFGRHGIPGESCATLKPRVIREDSSTMYWGKYDFLPKISQGEGGRGG